MVTSLRLHGGNGAHSKAGTERRRSAPPDEALLVKAFARIDAVAMGAALGLLLGLGILTATTILVVKGGDVVGPNLRLLGQYFPGYTVTPSGALAGLLYGAALGFALGWLAASLRNLLLRLYVAFARLRAQVSSFHDTLDPQ
jgi:hypothetical protein